MKILIRNLATMTRVGLIAPLSAATGRVIAELGSEERLRKARVHPIAVLSALLTYAQGKGVRGQNTWTPVQQIVDALDSAFYLSFGNAEPIGTPVLLALDVSGSMESGMVAGVPGLTPRLASAAMALVTANVEPNYQIMGFSHHLVDVPISPRMRLDEVVKTAASIPMGGTDCALPMLWASGYEAVGGNDWYSRPTGYERTGRPAVDVGAFIVYTDSETWYGAIHPAEALRRYRQATGVPAKLAVVGMVANTFTIADPNDAGMLDVVGFDTAAPQLISDFARESEFVIA